MAASPQIALRPMLPSEEPVLTAIFVASVDELTADDYDAGQRAAWAAVADDEIAFAGQLQNGLTLVATLGGAPVGFATLRVPDQLEMLYVLPSAAGQGAGAALCDACEKLARTRGAKELIVQASDTAQGFFAKRGYVARQRGTMALGDEWLGRTDMRMPLAPTPA